MDNAEYVEIDPGSIYLEPCENGFILCWEKKIQLPGCGCGPYDGRMKWCNEKEVFTAKEGSKALARMMEIFKMSGEEMEEM